MDRVHVGRSRPRSRARPDHAALRALLAPHGALGLYLVHVDSEPVRARGFAASGAIGEVVVLATGEVHLD